MKGQSGEGEKEWLGSRKQCGCGDGRQESWWILGWLSISGESGGPG